MTPELSSKIRRVEYYELCFGEVSFSYHPVSKTVLLEIDESMHTEKRVLFDSSRVKEAQNLMELLIHFIGDVKNPTEGRSTIVP